MSRPPRNPSAPDQPVSSDRSDSFTPAVIYKSGEHSIVKDEIDVDALRAMQRLTRYGYKGYLVGGAVRDLLLAKTPKDFDISTDATPRQIKALFRNSRVIGRRFKLVHLYYAGGKIIQVSTFRDAEELFEAVNENEEKDQREREGEERNQGERLGLAEDNVFGDECSDAFRRDLTINGLFYDEATDSIIDYVGGVEDLKRQIVRVIGNPGQRYKEDPVRMMRVLRHAARTGFTIEDSALNGIHEHHQLLTTAPAMRIFEEVKKDLKSGHILPTLRMFDQHHILQHLFPDLFAQDLFSETHYLARSLRRVDELVFSDDAPAPAPVLAVLALGKLMHSLIRDEDERSSARSALRQASQRLTEQFVAQDDIREFMRTAFPDLAVPRREKERVEELLVLWWSLRTSRGESPSPQALARRSCIPELSHLFRMLGSDELDEEICVALEELQAANASSERHRGPSLAQRHRGGPGAGEFSSPGGGRGRSRRGGRRGGGRNGGRSGGRAGGERPHFSGNR